MTNYEKYRGKCKELTEALVKEIPTLTIVRGHYFDHVWGRDEPHWWCVNDEGVIYDPSRLQFPTEGDGIYTPYSGYSDCEHCGKQVAEKDIIQQGRYPCCSDSCALRLVGL